MQLEVKRVYMNSSYTIGHLYVNGEYFCDTLEDPNRDLDKNGEFNCPEYKENNNTCIPFGEYKVLITLSRHFKRELPILLNVPEFSGIRIHRGNSSKDTSGCILVGKNTKKGRITSSAIYEKKLVKLLKNYMSTDEKINISIV